jgi:hypothetical protein
MEVCNRGRAVVVAVYGSAGVGGERGMEVGPILGTVGRMGAGLNISYRQQRTESRGTEIGLEGQVVADATYRIDMGAILAAEWAVGALSPPKISFMLGMATGGPL